MTPRMTSVQRDRLAGGILLLVAVLWIVGVYWTIPEVAGGARVGPRGFPLAMGVLLAGLSLFMIVGSLFGGEVADEAREVSDTSADIWALASTFGFLGGYILLLDWFGFLVGTVAATALFLVLVLKRRSPRMVAAVSLGLALTIWLVLGKAMGVYLPRGSLIDWF
jgi:hypothetical protein